MTEQPTNPKAHAKAAKAYAKASRKWYQKKRYIALIILGVLVIIGAATSGGGDSDNTANNDSSSVAGTDDTSSDTSNDDGKKAEKKEPAPKAVKVEATDLIKAFEDNEFAADQQYKGKMLEVSGVVNKVETELFDSNDYYLQIGGGGDFELLTVNCHGISDDELAKVSTGEPVTVVGKFDDGGSLGVEVKDCHLK